MTTEEHPEMEPALKRSRSTSYIISPARCRAYILAECKKQGRERFTRVSSRIDHLDAKVKAVIKGAVHSHPSKGKTMTVCFGQAEIFPQ